MSGDTMTYMSISPQDYRSHIKILINDVPQKCHLSIIQQQSSS